MINFVLKNIQMLNFKFETPNYDWEILKKYKIQKLNIDEAILNITSTDHQIWMYSLISECYKCPFTRVKQINTNSWETLIIQTDYDKTWKFYDSDYGKYVDADDMLSEIEVYFFIYNFDHILDMLSAHQNPKQDNLESTMS